MARNLEILVLIALFSFEVEGWLRPKGSHYVKTNTHSSYSYDTYHITQPVSHFSFTNNQTFSQRYLVNKEHWEENKGPIFFYCGNEGDITWFANNTGFMWDIAPEFKAMLVFAEHRYYGETMPFGKDSFKDVSYLGYLTSEQALADFAVLIRTLKQEHGDVPVIAFGGSYGGMLSAWIRLKYPGLVEGSIAASAPIWQFTNLTLCDMSWKIISEDIRDAGTSCYTNVGKTWRAIDNVARSNGGTDFLTEAFNLCRHLDNTQDLVSWLREIWFDLAMVNYPYPASFMEPLPAWPLKEVCKHFSDLATTDHKLGEAVKVYYNYSGQAKCLNLSVDSTVSLGERGWDFQACTEMVMPSCSNGVSDVFPVMKWDIDAVSKDCHDKYGVWPKPYWIKEQYGGKNINASSNIVFSNGRLDPWSGGGVLTSLSDSLVAVLIPNGAHHLDLRASNPADPDDVKHARDIHRQNIKSWLAD